MNPDGIKDQEVAATVNRFAEATNMSLIIVDQNGRIAFVNPCACALFGYEREEMIGEPITIIIPHNMRGAHQAGVQRVADGHAPTISGKPVEVSALRKDGSEFPIEITLSVWSSASGLMAGAVIKDITERREREIRLMRMASQDTLTGLGNRHKLIGQIDECLAVGENPAVLLFDLDGFKDINDTHGHLIGDALLKAVGVRISYLLEGNAMLARLGGDEFAVLLKGVNAAPAAEREARRIVEAFRKPFELGGLVLEPSASLGIAFSPDHGRDAEELLASADYALHRAKAAGGRNYRLFDHAMRAEAQARRDMRDALRQALREGQLELRYQPQVRLDSGRIIGCEALIRWNHPKQGLLLPGAFLPALEQSTLALEIGWWTLSEACRTIARINADGANLKVGVNLFPIQLRAPNLRDKVAEALDQHGLQAACLELEVTEEVMLGDDDSLRTLTELRQMGVGIAFDDFGTGFASLRSLQQYPLTTLKIDRGFVKNIDSCAQDAAITAALISMGRGLGLEIIAEGIETLTQENALLGMGCPSGQGYRYGRPVPASAIERQIAGWAPVERISA